MDLSNDRLSSTIILIITAWKVSRYRVFLVHIFLHMDWIRRFTFLHALRTSENLDVFRAYRKVNLCIQSKCGKIRTKKTPYLDTFDSVCLRLSSPVYQEVLYLSKIFSLDKEVFVVVFKAVQTGEKNSS